MVREKKGLERVKYPKLVGICKEAIESGECLGCNRLENVNFRGLRWCRNLENTKERGGK